MVQDRQFQAAQVRRPQDQPEAKRMIATTPPEQRIDQPRAMVNSSCNAVGGNAGYLVRFVTQPPETSVFCCYVSCVTVGNNSEIQLKRAKCLNTGRRYDLTEAGFRGILHPSKSRKAISYILKRNQLNRVVRTGQRASTVRAGGGTVDPLRSGVWCARSFFTRCLSKRGEGSDMSTLNNPSCVCGSHSPQVETLYRQSLDWPEMEATAPVITGDPLPSGMAPPVSVPEYPVYLVSVPADFSPNSWHTVPPGCNHYPSGEVAAEVVAVMNRAIIRASRDGGVSRWFIRLRKSTGGASMSVQLKEPFFPRSEYDMPPAFMTMRGQVIQWQGTIADLNERLSRAANSKGKVMRAYVAHSIRPDELRPIPTGDQSKRESVSSGGDAGPQFNRTALVENLPPARGDSGPRQHQPGSIYLVDVPSDYEPFNWKSLPGSFQKVKDKQAAKAAALGQNRRLLARSVHGIVYAWYIVVTAPKSFGIVQLNIPAGWRPIDAYDMPEPMTVIHEKKRRKESVTKLNQQLDRDHSRGRKRAYVAIPIERPEVMEMQPQGQPEPQEATQAGSVIDADLMRRGHFQTDTRQHEQNCSCSNEWLN